MRQRPVTFESRPARRLHVQVAAQGAAPGRRAGRPSRRRPSGQHPLSGAQVALAAARQWVLRADSWAPANTGNNIAVRVPMSALTTGGPIRVKPLRRTTSSVPSCYPW